MDLMPLFRNLGVMGLIIASAIQIVLNSIAMWVVINHMMGEQDSKESLLKCLTTVLMLYVVIVVAILILLFTRIPFVTGIAFWAVLALGSKAVIEGNFEMTEGANKVLFLYLVITIIIGWGVQALFKEKLEKANRDSYGYGYGSDKTYKEEEIKWSAVMPPFPEDLPSIDQKANLIKNGDFKTFDGWKKEHTSGYGVYGDYETNQGLNYSFSFDRKTLKESFAMNNGTNYVVWSRNIEPQTIDGTTAYLDGIVGISQVLDLDVTKLQKIIVSLDVWVGEHNVREGAFTGFQAPVILEIRYEDPYQEWKTWRRVFLPIQPPAEKVSKHIVTVEKEKWHHFSVNLLDENERTLPFLPQEKMRRPDKIKSIRVLGCGWSFKGAVGNLYIGETEPVPASPEQQTSGGSESVGTTAGVSAFSDSVQWAAGGEWTNVKIEEVRFHPQQLKFYVKLATNETSAPNGTAQAGWFSDYSEIKFGNPAAMYHVLWHATAKAQMGEFWSFVNVKRIWVEASSGKHGIEITTNEKSIPQDKAKVGSYFYFEAIKIDQSVSQAAAQPPAQPAIQTSEQQSGQGTEQMNNQQSEALAAPTPASIENEFPVR